MRWARQVETPRVIANDTELNCRILELLKHVLSRRYNNIIAKIGYHVSAVVNPIATTPLCLRYWPSFFIPNSHINSIMGFMKPAPELNHVRELVRAKGESLLLSFASTTSSLASILDLDFLFV